MKTTEDIYTELLDLVERYNDLPLSATVIILNTWKEDVCKKQDEEIEKLEFMIENGLGWKDMENDIQLPHEL